MWESFFAAVPTVRICYSKAQQCEIKKLNINRYTLEEGAAVQAAASLAGGWLELYFLDLPSSLLHLAGGDAQHATVTSAP